jgi:polyhydroxyalkanoate synthesis repressor PhaR
MITIKKYSNRRLYDTSESRYVTLEELAEKIRRGSDVRVIDAKTEEDLTQAILAQIIIESRGAARLLPTTLLLRLIRMEDDALAEFFGHYMVWALDVYRQVRRGAETLGPLSPLAGLPFTAPNMLARLLSHLYGWGDGAAHQAQLPMPPSLTSPQPVIEPDEEDEPPVQRVPSVSNDAAGELARMRREIEELRALIESK